MKWSEMTPAQINRLVAEKVFGYQIGSVNDDNDSIALTEGAITVYQPLPTYSTDMSATWTVAEKMAQDWYDFGIQADKDTEGQWIVMWGYDGHGWDTVTGVTAPEAICHAALLAAGVEFEPEDTDKKQMGGK